MSKKKEFDDFRMYSKKTEDDSDPLEISGRISDVLFCYSERIRRIASANCVLGNYRLADEMFAMSEDIQDMASDVGNVSGLFISEQVKSSQNASRNVFLAALAGTANAIQDGDRRDLLVDMVKAGVKEGIEERD